MPAFGVSFGNLHNNKYIYNILSIILDIITQLSHLEKAYITFYTRMGRSTNRLVLTSERSSFDERAPSQSYDYKLDESLSRTKSIARELRFCNSWDYFATLTISPDKADRYSWKECCKKISTFFNNFKKRYAPDFKYLLVPESHIDGAIHCHALLSGIPWFYINSKGQPVDILSIPLIVSCRVDYTLDEYGRKVGGHLIEVENKKQYISWLSYTLGWCSLERIRNQDACASYILKYITKSVQVEFGGESFLSKGDRILRCSTGLNRAYKISFDVDIKNTGLWYELVEYLGRPFSTDFCDIFQDLTAEQISNVEFILNKWGGVLNE